jgi:hypothetical protein
VGGRSGSVVDPAQSHQQLAQRQSERRGDVAETLAARQADFPSFQTGDVGLAKRGVAVRRHPRRQFLLAPAKLAPASLDDRAQGTACG